MITLFGNLESGNVHKVQMILHRLGLGYRRVDVAQTRGEPRRPEYLALNPIGKVPAVLLNGNDVLSESGAILYYFAAETELWPQHKRAQAEVLRWILFEQYNHEPALAVIRYLLHYADDPGSHSERIASLAPKARQALGVMESRLAAQPWLVNGGCTLADYVLYPYTRLADETDIGLDEFPAVRNWLSQMESQSRFLPVYQDGAIETVTFAEYFDPVSLATRKHFPKDVSGSSSANSRTG
jgi:glutathione S-transferase